MSQLPLWSGEFGTRYTETNNDLDFFNKRLPFWIRIMFSGVRIDSVLEIGCNRGHNLRVINEFAQTLKSRGYDPQWKLYGVEPNPVAAQLARESVPPATIWNQSAFDPIEGTFDLVFTSGVLCHMDNDECSRTLEVMAEHSNGLLLSAEYYCSLWRKRQYRQNAEIFMRPYDRIGQVCGWKILDCDQLPKSQGFDNVYFWLWQK